MLVYSCINRQSVGSLITQSWRVIEVYRITLHIRIPVPIPRIPAFPLAMDGSGVVNRPAHSHKPLICTRRTPCQVSGLDLPPFLTQTVETQNPSNGELSHGIVS